MDEARRRFGPISVLGNVVPLTRERLHVLALGPDCNRRVLGNPSTFVSTGQAWPGRSGSALRRIRYGLTRTNGPKHRHQRRLIMPALGKRSIESYIPAMSWMVRQLMEEWPLGRPVDMWQLLRRLAVHMASQLLFGEDNLERAMALSREFQHLQAYTYSPAVWALPWHVPGTAYYGMHRCAERIEKLLLEMIADHRRRSSPRENLLDLLVQTCDQAGPYMTDTDLIGQTAILFVASYENVANSMTWTLFLLAQHPHVMAQLYHELSARLRGDPASLGQLERLPFLDAVIRESLRVLTPVPYVIRKVDEPTELEDVRLRKGDRVVCSPYVTHHLPDLYPEPERFRPERWLGINPGPYEYLPFGAGPRLCAGSTFALTEMKLVLAMLVRRFRFTMVPGSRIDHVVQVMMKPKHGMPMTLHPQDRRFQAMPTIGDIGRLVHIDNEPVTLPMRRAA
jgi:cytochrome P450